ncbi:hypothetical protein GCM10022409_23620 [Hymenobacter glaciei]|uniref:GH16 domain-containing protein n=1 Tax=Hymenobacter glaciei TaxID=877209 RepID=A0ABP7UAF6_9BACT
MVWSVVRFVGILVLLGLSSRGAQAQRRINYNDWRLEWSDEFNKASDTVALANHWNFAFPWGRNLINNLETEFYTGAGVRADSGGVLHLVARKLDKPISYLGKQLRYSSGMLMSHHPDDPLRPKSCPDPADGFSYGLFEVRCRQPAKPNVFPAFWLWGGGPDEFDVFEGGRDLFANTIHTDTPGYWYPTRTHTDGCSCVFYDKDPAGDLHDQFHTYGLEWRPNEAIFYFDGYPIRRETRLLATGCAMYVIVNLAMWNWADMPADTLHIDYIRVYRPRSLPDPVAVVRWGGLQPGSEYEWTPFEHKPGRAIEGRVQRWEARPRPGGRLDLQLVDNLNAACEVRLPLPVNNRWDPPWLVYDGLPDVRLRFTAPDSVAWQLADRWGRPVVSGTALGGTEWLPRWPSLPPGHYALHLRQGSAVATQTVIVLGRGPLDAQPLPAWLEPVPPPVADSVAAP